MDAIELMMEEHKYIKRVLRVVRYMSIAVLNGENVPFDDFYKGIEFIKNYADKHHHNKEEKVLFIKMREDIGKEKVDAPISGMEIEHDWGRLFIKTLEEALERVKNGDSDSKVDIIANAICYTDLLNRHIDKEDKVIYSFARRALSENALKSVNVTCEDVENTANKDNLQKYYTDIVEDLEKKWFDGVM